MPNNKEQRENPLDAAARIYESGRQLKEKWTSKADGMSKEELSRLARVLGYVSLIILIVNIVIYVKKNFL